MFTALQTIGDQGPPKRMWCVASKPVLGYVFSEILFLLADMFTGQ